MKENKDNNNNNSNKVLGDCWTMEGQGWELGQEGWTGGLAREVFLSFGGFCTIGWDENHEPRMISQAFFVCVASFFSLPFLSFALPSPSAS